MGNIINMDLKEEGRDITSMVNTVMEKIQDPDSLTVIFNNMAQETKIKEEFCSKLKKILKSCHLNVSEEKELIILRIIVGITQSPSFVKNALGAVYGTNHKGIANFEKQLKKSTVNVSS